MQLALLQPLIRQGVQFAMGGLVVGGVATASDVTAIAGGIGSALNVAWMIYANRKAQ